MKRYLYIKDNDIDNLIDLMKDYQESEDIFPVRSYDHWQYLFTDNIIPAFLSLLQSIRTISITDPSLTKDHIEKLCSSIMNNYYKIIEEWDS